MGIKTAVGKVEECRTTFGEIVFAPNSNEAKLFIKASSDDFYCNKGADLIISLLNIRLKGFVLCLCKSIKDRTFSYDITHWKLGWLVTMTIAFMILKIFKDEYVEKIVIALDYSIEKSSFDDKEKKELSGSIDLLKGLYQKNIKSK